MKILLATVFGAATGVTAKNAVDVSSATTVPCDGALTSKILQSSDTVEVVGCSTFTDPKAVCDGLISDFSCTKGPLEKFGQIIISNPGRFSTVEGFRRYASTAAFDDRFDLLDYKVEGRGGGTKCYVVNDPGEEEEVVTQGKEPWKLQSKGSLPNSWVTGTPDRNTNGTIVPDSFNKGNIPNGLSYSAVKWKNDGTVFKGKPVTGAPLAPSECRDYRISFKADMGGTRGGDVQFAFGEIELVGSVTSSCPPGPVPTKAPSATSNPTMLPTTSSPTKVPSLCSDVPVANILLPSDSIEVVGCIGSTTPENAVDGTTASFSCVRNTTTDVLTKQNGIISINLRRKSIALGLRVYPSAGSDSRDPIYYKVEGREGPNCYRVNDPGVDEPSDVGIESIQTWRVISKGDLPWFKNATYPRNGANELINDSDSGIGDTDLEYTAVTWTNDGSIVDGTLVSSPTFPSECRDYRITFSKARGDSTTLESTLEVGEVELVGVLTDSCTLTTPTAAPFSCTTLEKRRDCKNTAGCFWKNSNDPPCQNE